MEGEFVDSLLSFHQHDQGRLGPLMPCFWWTLVHFRSKEKLFSGRQSATRVKRCRSFFFREFYDDFVLFFFEFSVLFTCGSIWIKIFTASPLTQTKRQTSVLYDVQGAESEPIIVCRCLERPTTTRFFALPLKLIPPVSIDFTVVYSPSTCYWHVSVSLISFIKKNCLIVPI